MRSFRHWTPRYIKNRLAELYYRKAYPDHPWLTRTANQILVSYLKESDVGLEFGSGSSTIWFAKRTKHITSVEHNEVWYNKVKQQITDEVSPKSVDYHMIPKDASNEKGKEASYVRFIDRFEADSLDYILVDGIYRDFCTLSAIKKVRPGGIIIVDNINRYLPHDSHSPDTRRFKDGPKSRTWGKINQLVSDWRIIWTSSGVTDTALLFKPCKYNR
jgi:SAM-dependent methyltransferase